MAKDKTKKDCRFLVIDSEKLREVPYAAPVIIAEADQEPSVEFFDTYEQSLVGQWAKLHDAWKNMLAIIYETNIKPVFNWIFKKH